MFLDSAIVVKLIVRENNTDFFVQSLKGHILFASELSLVEVPSALFLKARSNLLSEEQRHEAVELFEAKLHNEEIVVIPVDSKVYREARWVMDHSHPDVALRSLDAIQIATCSTSREFPLCATDSRLRAAAKKLHIPIFPETLPS
jgi:predicted nucleic acid-binding protein